STIEDLREKLRRQKTSVDSDTQNKVSKIEEEISREWQAKSERMLSAAAEKYNRQLADLKDEKEDLMNKVEELEKKLTTVRSSGSSTEQQVAQLQDELAEMQLWKEKYDNLRTQAAAMKERYEKRIGELEGEKDEEEEKRNELSERAKEQRQELQQRVQQLQQEVQQLKVQLSTSRASVKQTASASTSAAPPAGSSADVATEVKKIMNSVFQTLRSEFDADESYLGSEVLATILNVIKIQAKHEGTLGAPVSTHLSGNDSTTHDDVPSLDDDDDVKDVDIPRENPEETSKIVDSVAGDDDEDFFSDDSKTGEKSESGLVTDNTSQVANELESDDVVKDVEPSPETALGSQHGSDPVETSLPSASFNDSSVMTEKVLPGGEVTAAVPESSGKKEITEQAKQDLLAASLNVPPKPVTDSREPPPLFDDDDDDDDSSLFGTGNTLPGTRGSAFKPVIAAGDVKSAAATAAQPASKDKTVAGKKREPANDDDLKPQPPPPLFGDDSDDDDLDWLS
ncbi:unnamed protein product, partial [Candidula unifasciata]